MAFTWMEWPEGTVFRICHCNFIIAEYLGHRFPILDGFLSGKRCIFSRNEQEGGRKLVNGFTQPRKKKAR